MTSSARGAPPGAGDEEVFERAARWVLAEFDAYYGEYQAVPAQAKAAFEQRDPARSLALSRRRLSLYSGSIARLAPRLNEAFPSLLQDEGRWRRAEAAYQRLIAGRYEADLAHAYIQSARRHIFRGEWHPIDYALDAPAMRAARDRHSRMVQRFELAGTLDPQTVLRIFEVARPSVPFRDAAGDAQAIADRVGARLAAHPPAVGAARHVDMIGAGFYRNRGAYLVGRIGFASGHRQPFIVALLNSAEGIYADAVITEEADAHNIFSSTLANFHVRDHLYHELAAFLHDIMPARPLGLHYSTIGFNHLGKVAVMHDLEGEFAARGEQFTTAVGDRGTVAIGFAAPSSEYNLKVIRDHPSAQYKWGEFAGIESVLRKYSRVHEINRTGSMLDNIIYYNVRLSRGWFEGALLEDLLRDAPQSVSEDGDAVLFKVLIVQRRLTPLPVFLEHATPEAAQTAIVNLGHCIKNNAAANIFNKDLDARNYGVSRFLKVYLFDYDALEDFTDVKIRSNDGREEGEEDVPDWYFEEGVVFLPGEIEAGLMLGDRALRRVFRSVHGDLLSTAYWERLQQELREGKVPTIRTYPEECELRPPAPDAGGA